MGIWRLEVITGNTDQRKCPKCRKEEVWSHILKCKRNISWRDELVNERFKLLV
jgi:hypothetical protein